MDPTNPAVVHPPGSGTPVYWNDMLLLFTAETFLYVGTVAVIPELLQTGEDKLQEVKKT